MLRFQGNKRKKTVFKETREKLLFLRKQENNYCCFMATTEKILFFKATRGNSIRGKPVFYF